MGIKISSDSTCDLSREIAEKYGVAIIPLTVVLEGKSYRDGVDIHPDDVFSHVSNGGQIATTAAVNTEDYRCYFEELLKDHDGVVHFTISNEMSSSYQNAYLAAQELKNVYVVDSMTLSTGIGQLVLDAALMAAEGKSAEEIFNAVEEKKAKLDVSFVLNTLEYLRKGGRCSALAALGANILGLKPCIEVRNGKMGVGKKYRGKFESCLLKYIADRLGDVETVDTKRVFITDSGVAKETYEAVEAAVKKCAPFEEVIHTRAGCTISNHCGPDCLGILFYRK